MIDNILIGIGEFFLSLILLVFFDYLLKKLSLKKFDRGFFTALLIVCFWTFTYFIKQIWAQ